MNVYVLGKTFLVLARELCINAPAIGIFFNDLTFDYLSLLFLWLLEQKYACMYIYTQYCMIIPKQKLHSEAGINPGRGALLTIRACSPLWKSFLELDAIFFCK